MQLIQIFSIILFAAYTVTRLILVRFISIFRRSKTLEKSAIKIFSLKIVKQNSIGGAIVVFAAYSVYGQISVRFLLEIFGPLVFCCLALS